jgi:hypothetical protein
MKKIKLYCYKTKETNFLHERIKPFDDKELFHHEFLGTRTIELEEPPKEEPKRIELWINRDEISKKETWSNLDCSHHETMCQTTKLVELKDGERILSRDDVKKALTECVVANKYEVLKELGFDE